MLPRASVAALVVAVVLLAHASQGAIAGAIVRKSSRALNVGDGAGYPSATDGEFMYAPTTTNMLIKFNVNTMQRVAALTPSAASGRAVTIEAGIAYLATVSIPAQIVKVNATTMLEIAALSLSGQTVVENNAYAVASDAQFVYAACVGNGIAATVISRVAISTFDRAVGAGATQIQLQAGEKNVYSMVTNPAKTALFACTNSAPDTKCVRIELAGFTRTGGATFAARRVVTSIVHDSNTFLFLACQMTPAVIVKVDTALPLGTMLEVGVSALGSPNDNAKAVLLLPGDAAHVYAVISTTPMRVIKLRKTDMSLATPILSGAAGDAQVAYGAAVGVGTRAFVMTASNPAVVVQWGVPTRTRTATHPVTTATLPTTTTTTVTTTTQLPATTNVGGLSSAALAATSSGLSERGIAGVASAACVVVLIAVLATVFFAHRNNREAEVAAAAKAAAGDAPSPADAAESKEPLPTGDDDAAAVNPMTHSARDVSPDQQ